MLLFLIYIGVAFLLPSVHQNITYFSYSEGYYFVYLFVIISTNITLTYHCYLLSKGNNKYLKLTILTSLTMLLGALLPYHVESNDIFSTLHVMITTFSNILLFYLIALFIEEYKYIDYSIYQKLFQLCMYCISCVGIFLVFFGSINIVVEISLLASILYLLKQLQIYKKYILN